MKKLVLFLLATMLLSLPSIQAFAAPEMGRPNDTKPPGLNQIKKVDFNDRLDGAKLKTCQVKEKVINNRTKSLTNLALNMEDKFTSISARVQKYYTEKVVPSGKTVPNYASLVADINAKKAAVDTAINTAKTDSSNFSCNSDNPKGKLSTFRKDMQNVKSSLKDYRTSIKNLIVAVRSIVGETEKKAAPSGGKR